MAPQSDPPPSRAGRECFIHRFVDRDQVSALRRPFVERTHAAKASIPSSSVSKRIEWNRSNECCAPGSSAYTTGCDETCRSLARGLRIRSVEGGSGGWGRGVGERDVVMGRSVLSPNPEDEMCGSPSVEVHLAGAIDRPSPTAVEFPTSRCQLLAKPLLHLIRFGVNRPM
jgi:hypothetical protein